MTDAAPETAGPPPIVLRLLGMTTYVGLAGFVVAEVVAPATGGWSGFAETSLLNALVWLAGVNSFIVGCGHLAFPDRIAESIGWPKGTRGQPRGRQRRLWTARTCGACPRRASAPRCPPGSGRPCRSTGPGWSTS
ncbi:DUF6790 family protein [Pseudonocardia xishanensis]|uniref:Uncharacterized protein n=1 Tax=Pseudonocardia xishanensis TaxID=630995 RepID=A0ABP8RHB4_9PSEU